MKGRISMKMKKLTETLIITALVFTFSAVTIADEPTFWEMPNYKGAFGSTNWAKGWTAVDEYGYFSASPTPTTQVDITDADINAGDQVYWTADNIYVLDGFVYVEEGAVLNIEAGTVIKFQPGGQEDASGLIICRGAKIYAEGTAEEPIIFTALSDDINDPYDLTADDRGLWGGLGILGYAEINPDAGEDSFEGLSDDPRALFGGEDNDDCSGVMRYCSIRHGGSEIAPGDELNGLGMAGVGRNTVIEYIEAFANSDDGFEWWGGTVNCKHLVSAFCGDDAFDHDQGLQCYMQFLFAIQDPTTAGHMGEHDGGQNPEEGTPFAYPIIYNATFLGTGEDGTAEDAAFNLRDNWGGEYKNSIFGDHKGQAMNIEEAADKDSDSKRRYDAGEIVFTNNLWFDFAPGDAPADLGVAAWDVELLSNNNNDILTDSPLANISRAQTNSLDPRPAVEDGVCYQNLADIPENDFFEQVNYKGAFGSSNWCKGWTALDEYGYFTPDPVPTTPVDIVDTDINAGDHVYWTAENIYQLDGFVFVEDGAVLNIEAGTVIKFQPGGQEDASGLIIAKGGKIYAEGTGVSPIIFTALSDDITDPYDLTAEDRGLWGGLGILGYAEINPDEGEDSFEGLTDDPRALFGGEDNWDCSGIMRYCSIRHGGSEIAPGDELNGLGMAGVGRLTKIEYVEAFANSDDGFEWWGGHLRNDHLVSAFCGDDSYDHDQGMQTQFQYLFAIQDPTTAGHLCEHDGGQNPEEGTPFAYPVTFNATFLGTGEDGTAEDAAFNLRDNWGGEYKNSIFGSHKGQAMNIEEAADKGSDSKRRYDAGEIVFTNNLWFDFAPGDTPADLGVAAWDVELLSNNDNDIIATSPLNSIARTQTGDLDPRPIAGGDAYQNLAEMTSVSERMIPNSMPVEYSISQNYPNPFNPVTTIEFAMTQNGQVTLEVFNLLGQKVATLVDGFRAAGKYVVQWDASNMQSGMYIYRIQANDFNTVKKMTLIK